MLNQFISTAQAGRLIESGAVLFVAGSGQALASLPKGRWIGGSTPYFMTPDGGMVDHEHVFCTVVEGAQDMRIAVVREDDLQAIVRDRLPSGFSYVLIPAFTGVHKRFALEAPGLPKLYEQPLVGWVTGVELTELGKVSPTVVDGATGQVYEDAGLVMHVGLSQNVFAEADIVNLFTQGSGPDIVFSETGFSASQCEVDGKRVDFASWLREQEVDTSLPLVSSYAGAMINVSFQAVLPDQVEFYAPVVAGRVYRLAAPVGDYAEAYGSYCTGLHAQGAGNALSFNCILNYQYAALQGRTTGGFIGPVTFGEIAYILLNQTLVRLDLSSAQLGAAA